MTNTVKSTIQHPAERITAADTGTPRDHPSRPRVRTRRTVVLVGLAGLVLAVFLLDLVFGSVSVPLRDVVAVLLGGRPSNPTWTNIVMIYRLPKAVAATAAGSALAMAGLQMQTIFRNPLADSSVLGVNAGASLGVALLLIAGSALSPVTNSLSFLQGFSGIGNLGVVAAAFVGAGFVMLLIVLASARLRSVLTLLVLGLMFGYVASSLVSLLLYFADAQRVQSYVIWTFGTFDSVTWPQMVVFLPAMLIAVLVGLLSVKSLNALLLGEAYARSLGLHVRRARLLIIGGVALLVGTATAFCGPIAFIGIAVPHLCRGLLNTSDHRILMPATLLLGAAVALASDLVAQLPGTGTVLPLNAVTALLGAPVVAWVILRRHGQRAVFV